MALWILLYFLLMFAFAGVAIYEYHTASVLSLPLSPALTALAIVLPFLGLANSFALPYAFPGSTGRTAAGNTTATTNYARLFQAAQLLQLILSVVLATRFFGDAGPASPLRACLLSTAWQRMFASKDGAAIRRIQDALDCCGLNSVRDRAWPFAEDIRDGTGVACAERFGRTASCARPWAATLQRSAGVDGGIVTGVAVLQVVLALLWQWAASRYEYGGQQQRHTMAGWPRQLLAPFTTGAGAGTGVENGDAGARRPLLGAGDGRVAEEVEEDEEADNGSNCVDEEQGHVSENGTQTQTQPRNGGYGSTGPRVEPSYQPGPGEPNAWRE